MKSFNLYVALVAVVILSMLMSGCAAVSIPQYGALPMQPGSTIYGVREALRGATGTGVFMKDGMYLLSWSVKESGTAFAVLNGKPDPEWAYREFQWISQGKGTLVSWDSFNAITKAAYDNGWKQIPYTAVPAGMRVAVASAASLTVVAQTALPTIFVIPTFILEDMMNDPLKLINQETGA